MNGKLSSMLGKLGYLVNDGAVATQLEALGCCLNDELWSARILMDAPELIKKVHLSYFEAGADIGTSASYQATVPGFMKKGRTREEAEALIKYSVTLLREARGEWWRTCLHEGREYPLAAAAVGPYGAFLADGSEYRGHYGVTAAELKKFNFRRMELLRDAGADFFAIETLPSLAEACVLAEAADELELECWVTFSCRSGREICEGTPISDCARALAGFASVKAIGVNCTPPQYIEDLVRELRSASDLPVCVYPNSGEEYDAAGKTWHGPKDGLTFADYTERWLAAGASIIGGCCRTTPQDIAHVYEGVSKARNKK